MKAVAWYDLTFGIGLMLITAGLSLWSIPLAALVLGLLFCAIGARGAMRARATAAAAAPGRKESTTPIEEPHGLADQAV